MFRNALEHRVAYEALIRRSVAQALCCLVVTIVLALCDNGYFWWWVLGEVLLFLGLSLKFLWWWPRVPAEIPIVLMLHSVSDEVVDPECPNNTLRPKELETLIVSLQKSGYCFQTMDEALDNPLPRSVLLTFDDGYLDNYTALFPILKRTGAKATCYVTNRGSSDAAFVTPEQIREMQASGLVAFGGHTVHHTKLDEVPLAVAQEEIAGNVAWLTEVLGHAPRTFAYPCGGRTPEVIEFVKAQGYQAAVTMNKKMHPFAEDFFQIHRQIIPRGKTPWQAYALATRGKYKF